jgi:hypothetical protein
MKKPVDKVHPYRATAAIFAALVPMLVGTGQADHAKAESYLQDGGT